MATFISKEQILSWLNRPRVQGKHILPDSKKFSDETGFPAKILEDCGVVNEGEIHEDEGDVWFCLQGEVKFMCGGELENPQRHPTKKGELKGTGVRGGVTTVLKPGDWLWIPPGEPHAHSAQYARMIIIKIPKS